MENNLKENKAGTDLTKKLINEFQSYQSKLNGDASGNLNKLRMDAMSVFEKKPDSR